MNKVEYHINVQVHCYEYVVFLRLIRYSRRVYRVVAHYGSCRCLVIWKNQPFPFQIAVSRRTLRWGEVQWQVLRICYITTNFFYTNLLSRRRFFIKVCHIIVIEHIRWFSKTFKYYLFRGPPYWRVVINVYP